ncbi:unnamed protein product, partial [Rotaria sp. Silwood1]
PAIQSSISSYIPQTIQQPFIQTTNQQVIPTYIPSAIQPSISSLFSQTIQQPFTHTNIQETQQPISTLTRPIIRKPRSLSVPP